jgi:hypothetical protein
MPLWSYLHEGQLMPKPEIFFVTPELQQVLDALPPGTPRSKLGPLQPFSFCDGFEYDQTNRYPSSTRRRNEDGHPPASFNVNISALGNGTALGT